MINDEGSVELKGIVDTVTYKNKDSGYTVIKLKSGKDIIVVTGTMPFVSEGDSITVRGSYIMHPTYGRQFKCDFCEVTVPETEAQILKYLSGGAIKGVGPATAVKIVELFKERTLDVIENEPKELTRIKGISIDKALSIAEQFKQQFGIRDIMITLSRFNITPNEASLIFKTLGVQSIDIIKENPYSLCMDGIGFSFERVDEIAENFDITADNEYRIFAGIQYVLKGNLSNGHTCLPKKKLVDVSSRLLGVERDCAIDVLEKMIGSLSLFEYIIDGVPFVFLPDYAAAEEYIGGRINNILKNNQELYEVSSVELNFVQQRLGINFDPIQISAVNVAMKNSFFILTGGPGTGKTTTLNTIIEIFDRRDMSIGLAAPTGRAAKRMTELTGRDASTIHRLLEVEWGSDSKPYFAKNRKNPLDFDVLIIDEMSMVDVQLFRALLDALKITTRIILVGDSDQLPSVGAGNVLNDLIASEKVPFVKLEKIFRQAAQSSIITFSHEIIKGQIPESYEKASDFFFIKRNDVFSTTNTVIELCSTRLPEAYSFSPFEDIQVLCPSRKKECGTLNLNNCLQDVLNPLNKNEPELHFKGCAFRVGDKVMNIKNDYDIIWETKNGESGTGIFNGDIGFIESIDIKERALRVAFDDKIATYFDENLALLELAYATTVHKSQGCEFECVVVPLYDTSALLQYRNLLYTAITRAKKLIVLVGNTEIFENMIENDRKTLRYTALKYFLNGK